MLLDSESSALLRCLTHFISLKVQGHIKNLIEENFRDNLEHATRDPILFGDFRTALSEGEPRVYEDVQDYDAAKAIFQVVCTSLELCLRRLPRTAGSLFPLCVHLEFFVHRYPVVKIEDQLWSGQSFPVVCFH